MTNAAIISGSLVDVRNVGTHKSVKLTIHVPEEHATRIFAAFGWPTGVNPVSVAIARMTELPQRASVDAVGDKPRPASPPIVPAGADKERRVFADMPPPQQAGILCNEVAFQKFLGEKFPKWGRPSNAEGAADFVRSACSVKSRSDIKPDNADWSALVLAYRLWQREPEFVG